MDKFEKKVCPASRSYARCGELREFNFNYDIDPDNKVLPLKCANQQHHTMRCIIPYSFNSRFRETSRRKELCKKRLTM